MPEPKLGYNYVFECKKPLEAAYRLIGYHDEFDLTQKDEYDTRPYLPDRFVTDPYECKLNIMNVRIYEFSTKCMPVTLEPLQWFYLTSLDALQKFELGIVDVKNTKYSHSASAVIKSVTFDIPENGVCECTMDFSCEGFDRNSDIDYATEEAEYGHLPTTKPLSTRSLTDVSWNAIPLPVSKISIKIEYEVEEQWDSEVEEMNYYIKGRNVTVEFDLTEAPDAFITAINNSDSGDLTATIGGQVITITGVIFPENNLGVKAGEVVTETFSSLSAKGITFGF